MPRVQRRKSVTGIYHVILRGINKQSIFEEKQDYDFFLKLLRKYQEECRYELFAYCLMQNHIHLLIKEGDEPLEIVFRKIGAGYVYWYNMKYERTGHLFQDRYRSEPVENERYFLTVIRYIHLNPVKAGICEHPGEYRYSSYPGYHRNTLIQSDYVRTMITPEEFVSFHNQPNEDQCMEITGDNARNGITDEIAQNMLYRLYGYDSPSAFQKENKSTRRQIIKNLYAAGVSVRQISRITGQPKTTVSRCCMEKNGEWDRGRFSFPGKKSDHI